MDSENVVDSQQEVGYNTTNNEDNEEIIDLSTKKPIHDPECTHEQLVPDPEDRLGDAIYHGCANPNCIQGFYIQQT